MLESLPLSQRILRHFFFECDEFRVLGSSRQKRQGGGFASWLERTSVIELEHNIPKFSRVEGRKKCF